MIFSVIAASIPFSVPGKPAPNRPLSRDAHSGRYRLEKRMAHADARGADLPAVQSR
jgi:hypothetical protein